MLGKKEDGEQVRVVYRNYATLYFVFVVDGAESELGILDLIQVGGDGDGRSEGDKLRRLTGVCGVAGSII